jgi:hypothetical protein
VPQAIVHATIGTMTIEDLIPHRDRCCMFTQR